MVVLLLQEIKRYNWLTELIVPLDLFYDSNGENPLFALQDPLHVLKKARNNVKRLETRCLSLGIVSGKEEHCLIRWDLVYNFFQTHKEVMLHSSISAVNVTDKQDPSQVTDISQLYELFIFHGYTALGLYFKAVHFLAEAFLDKEINPYERVYKAWWCKNFFVKWEENTSYSGQHIITSQTFQDLICACDGLILYIQLLIKNIQMQKSLLITSAVIKMNNYLRSLEHHMLEEGL